MTQKVIVSTSLTPNILMHVFSCFEIDGSFYDSSYGMKHHFTIQEEEYSKWEELAKKCMTLGCNAELYAILFQIPSYIPAEDIEMILSNFDEIIGAVNEGTMDSLLESYPGVFDNLPIYAPMSVLNNHFKKLFEYKDSIVDIINQFKSILQGVWNRFYNEYWEKEAKSKLAKRQEVLTRILEPINVIKAWQKKIMIEFPYPEFNVTLVEPTTAIATNLLAEKIMVSSTREDIDVYKIIIHEVGRAFILNTGLFENEKLKPIAQTNAEKLSLIVDAVCIYFKKSLYQHFQIKDLDADYYNTSEIKQIIPIFSQIWEDMKEKNIYEALLQTYNKLYPIV